MSFNFISSNYTWLKTGGKDGTGPDTFDTYYLPVYMPLNDLSLYILFQKSWLIFNKYELYMYFICAICKSDTWIFKNLCHTWPTKLVIDPCTKICGDRLTFLIIFQTVRNCELPAGVETSVSNTPVTTAADYQYTCITNEMYLHDCVIE